MQTQQATTRAKKKSTWNGVERRRVEKVVETLAMFGGRGENLSEVAHDARNMVTALGLYCDLLEEPGVLANPFTHYAHELRLVASASRRLVEKLVALDSNLAAAGADQTLLPAPTGGNPAFATSAGAGLEVAAPAASGNGESLASSGSSITGPAPELHRSGRWELLPALPIVNLAAELLANRNLLAALAGPAVALTMETDGGARPARLTGEDLTRLLVNLVKNAAEAMPKGGRVHIGLSERETGHGAAPWLLVTVEDNGPGIPAAAIEKIFTSGYTSRGQDHASRGGWPKSHRGLGLAIARSIVEGAGGRIVASNRAQGGACFTLELPVRKGGF